MFQLLFERSTDPIWMFDPKAGVFLDCNEAAIKLLGYSSKNDLLLARPEDLSPPMQADGRCSKEAAVEIAARAEREGGLRFEWLARRATGEEVPLEVVATPIATNGKTLHVIVSRDISERKRADAELRANQQLLASIVDNITEAVYRTGPGHKLIFANRAYLRLSGYDSLAEMQMVPRETLYAHPPDRARLLDLLAREGEFRNEEIQYLNRQGKLWWGLTNSVAIRDPATGAVLYHVGSVKDISQRKKTQEELLKLNATLERRVAERTAELAASEACLRTLVEHAPEAIVVFDGETGRFRRGNAHACRIYGRSMEELTELTPAHVSPEFQANGRPSAQIAREKMDEALAGGAPVFEWIHRHSSGRLIPTEVRLVRLPTEDEKLLRASIIDNTERKRREKIQQATFQISEAVHTAEDLGSLYRQIHAIVMALMPSHNFYISIHDAADKLLNFPYFVDEKDACPASMPEGRGLTGYVLRTGRALLASRRNMVQRTPDGRGVIFDGDNEVPFVEQGAVPMQWLGAPMTIKGRPLGVLEVFDYHDENAYGEEEKQVLTFIAAQTALAIERKRAEQALRESEEKFRALFEASSAAVILHDEHQYLEVNPATLRIMGYERAEDLIGKNPALTSPPTQPNGESSATLAREHIRECMTKGSARFDWMVRTARGEDVPVEVTLTRIEWRGRRIIQAVITDISERKKAEAELLKALAREKELSALKSSFVSMVSHEFRTPLGIIMSSAEILEDYFEQLPPEERKSQLVSIRKNTRRMGELMEEVLVLSRFDAGKMDFKPAPLDFPVFCRRVVDEILSATNRACPIELTIAQSIGEAQADERLLRHIFTNLLSNAVKYSPPGSAIGFVIERGNQEIVCRVQDRGIGIPEADQYWLFKAFHRGRNVGERPGTGLGLVIVKRCVELHGGHIAVESKTGQGTSMIVRLPLFSQS
jgi:PAS domain S-box-containing protein